MRIALVADNSPLTPLADPAPGDQAARLVPLAQALARLGHRITIYARRDARAARQRDPRPRSHGRARDRGAAHAA
jgi:hypothetical protein